MTTGNYIGTDVDFAPLFVPADSELFLIASTEKYMIICDSKSTVDVITIIASAFEIFQGSSVQYGHQQQYVVRFVRFENDSTQSNSNAVKPLDFATALH
jgi:hypothetical protein